MEVVLGIIVIAVVLFLCFYFEKDKKRVEKLVEKKIERPNQVKTIQSTNNVVCVAKDKEQQELTSFALVLKDAVEKLEYEEKKKERQRQREVTRRQETTRQQADCVTSYTQSFEPECIDNSRNRYNDTSSGSSYSSGSSSSSSYDSSSSSSSDDSNNSYSSSSSSWD